MRKVSLKIRGIYTTALTRLFLDLGYRITQPSREILERFQIPESDTDENVSIIDRDDRQGIQISGRRALVEEVIRRLWEVFLDMVTRREPTPESFAGSDKEQVAFDLEFPGATKAVLDGLRAQVLPTIRKHHRLRIIASDYLDLIERQIEHAPHRRDRLEREFMERFVFQPFRKHRVVQVEHVKPEGEILKLREGEIVSLEEGRLFMKRLFQKGRYDGLDLAIEPGDYGITEVEPDGWSLRHRYFSSAGEPKGEYWNINTPIELYPDRIRYVDLHVDVVRRANEAARIIDQEELESITRRGLISPRLRQKAIEVSHHLSDQMNTSD